MITLSLTDFILVTTFLASSCLCLLVYIFNATIRRLLTVEENQKKCKINLLYSQLLAIQNDIEWIKQKQNKQYEE